MDMHPTMMHYRPWFQQQQQMLMEQNPYYQYAFNDLQAYYSSNDHQEEDNDQTGDEMPSETSGNQSPNADMFRLQFAASQWSKLVFNAEGLFNKLMSNNALPANEQILLKNQIEQWLCMKQEYEECIAADDSSSIHAYTENTRKSLERIEEVTETDEKTDESSNYYNLQSKRKSSLGSESKDSEIKDSERKYSDSIDSDEEVQSDLDEENSDFPDRLGECMDKFVDEIDEIVNSKKNNFSRIKNISPVPKPVINSSFLPIVKPITLRNPSSRRTSILPYSEMSNELAEFQKQNIDINLQQKDDYNMSPIVSQDSMEKIDSQEKPSKSFEEESASLKAIIQAQKITMDTEHTNAIRMLMISNEEKQSQVKKMKFHLNLLYKQVEELQKTIDAKEKLLEDMLQCSETRNNAKQKFQKKRSKIEEKRRNAKAKLDNLLMQKDAGDKTAAKEIEKYENLLLGYNKKLDDTKIIKEVASNSAKTVLYLKNSLSALYKEMEKLKQRLQGEEENKKTLEDGILVNRIRIKEMEKNYSIASLNANAIFENEEDRNHSRLKIKTDDKDNMLVEPNERISRLNDYLKEKLEIVRVNNMDDKETLRQEIRELRHLKDQMIDIKCRFNKYTNQSMLATDAIQWQLLVMSECVETLDAMIEQKNVMICGKANYHDDKYIKPDDQMLIRNGLEKLSHEELVTLFQKYFYKVIDLKDSCVKLEIQIDTLEAALKQQKMQNDTAIVMLQRYYERQINHLLNYYDEETSSSSYDNKLDKNRDFERLVKENQVLRRRLAHFDSLLKASATAQAVHSNPVRNTKRVIKPELMQIALPSKPNKVTRQKNKLIIQKEK
ncbi:kinesin B isoform X1 [Nasonia vitripennis]|uniref:Uncharacterized protein n=1 Tax=Nasonia vitripennis TaxID=7425 RepID=A0A7M7QMW0_NASVI|nr:kinesin B [Nasonia vitripennis]XP_016836656.1 kinesin B isoform X1 [Nasonia vitripennis]XP_031789388.1 kinesin B isoform X1 [Nasonia vitripennis]